MTAHAVAHCHVRSFCQHAWLLYRAIAPRAQSSTRWHIATAQASELHLILRVLDTNFACRIETSWVATPIKSVQHLSATNSYPVMDRIPSRLRQGLKTVEHLRAAISDPNTIHWPARSDCHRRSGWLLRDQCIIVLTCAPTFSRLCVS